MRKSGNKDSYAFALSELDRISSALDLSKSVKKIASVVYRKAEEVGLTNGRGPTGVVAAAVYVSSIVNLAKKTQKEVAEVAGITEATIRLRYKELAEKLGIEMVL